MARISILRIEQYPRRNIITTILLTVRHVVEMKIIWKKTGRDARNSLTINWHTTNGRRNFFFGFFFLKNCYWPGGVYTRTRANRRTRLRRDCRAVYVYACAHRRASERASDVHVGRRGKHKLPMLVYARTHWRHSLSGAKDVVVGRVVLASTGYDATSPPPYTTADTADPFFSDVLKRSCIVL